MQSYFSRFLHHTLSHSGIREVFTSSLSLSDLIGVSRSNQVANLSHLDYRVKPDNDSICAGRSMVEMLGVLAIIGVLSVGAIAGYSKAMMKYKLNQHAVAVNMLINNVLSIKDKLPHSGDDTTYYNYLLYKANLLPDGLNYNKEIGNLEEIYFKNKINVMWSRSKWTDANGNQGQDNTGIIHFYFPASDVGYEVCRNIVLAAKENAANIDSLATSSYSTNKPGTQTSFIYGDIKCSQSVSCLKNLNLDNIMTLCNNCKGETCVLGMLWK